MSIRSAALLFLGLAASLAGCTAAFDRQGMMTSTRPPREKALAASAVYPIEVAEVLHFRLPDGSGANVDATCQVAPDGTVQIGTSGKIHVAGKTLAEAQKAVGQAMAASSAVQRAIEIQRNDCYLVTVASDGDQKVSYLRMRADSDWTVLGALKDMGPASQLSRKIIWLVRPSEKNRILPVDWEGISNGELATNHRLQPGDFLFVADEPAKGVGRVFNAVTALFAPVE